ncbi:hypothetical protein MCOR27_009516 [Pyricularia oryzae]|nr:hypothetical protein MCOR27_009516 [Pyricularia oryzae]KAI6324142.1 hypothetical protein MCOR29_004202 [Pyricularia oryzae]KAI6362425.1 hypothetical protein MCOR31_008245 [Pyricularia oryzae]KAI6389916.1 hypothetical protein MCOR23_009826 [Pyricularia oryzae]KAI6398214.1 hypothetical protein MCOR20_009296 [Pyricularia oryzae]
MSDNITMPDISADVFETRQEALDFVNGYYVDPKNPWFSPKERAEVYKRAGKLFKDGTGGHVTTTTITGHVILIPIVRLNDSPFWSHVAPEAYRDGKFALHWEELGEEDLRELLKVRSKFRPSLVYVTSDQVVKRIQDRPEGPIRKDDVVFSPIESVRWGYDPPVNYPGCVTAKKMSERLAQGLENWERTEQGRGFNRQVQAVKDDRGKNNGFEFKRVVGIALGTMTEPCSVYQHCMVISLARQLGIREVWLQDPAYSTADKKALHEHGAKIANDDRVFGHIYSDSIVVCIAPAIPALELMQARVAAFKEWPAMLVWDRVGWHEWYPDRCTTRVYDMMDKYEILDLESPLDRDEFLETTVYVRRREQEFSGMPRG